MAERLDSDVDLQGLQVSTQPPLYPAFDPEVHDYIIRCADEPVQVSVTTPKQTRIKVDGCRAATGTFVRHVLLRTGQSFSLSAIPSSGDASTYHIRCIPLDFPAWTVQRSGPTHAQWHIVASFAATTFEPPPPEVSLDYVAIFDHNGVPVWWMRSPSTPIDAKLLPDGTLAWSHFPAMTTPYEVRKLDGSLVRTLDTVGTPSDLHDLQLLSNENYVLASYRLRDGVDLTSCGGSSDAEVQDAEIQEITPDSGPCLVKVGVHRK